jgi:hypothetical protein
MVGKFHAAGFCVEAEGTPRGKGTLRGTTDPQQCGWESLNLHL